jgi:hypothetical protein
VARCTRAVGATPHGYPDAASYDELTRELRVGDGIFGPVSPAVWAYSVSGLHVLGSWLRYRLRDGGGRQSSPLDAIRPTVWPAAFTEELLRVIWIIEHTLALQPARDDLIGRVIAGPTIEASELPAPSDAERAPPAGRAA